MRRRPSARLLVIDQQDRVLLFRFVHTRGALADQDYWATPGGALEEGETFAEAGRRELFEETGIVVDDLGEQVAEREFVLQLTDGEQVVAEERYFLVRVAGQALSRDSWTALEHEVMADHRWWSIRELATTREVIFPERLVAILASLGLPLHSIPRPATNRGIAGASA
ncbi:MAG TPA: NUDIX domain-containing protein [Chloroflexota bacterium]|nr:NUDIX domain-containing protein [Chloroflexota bacterium]